MREHKTLIMGILNVTPDSFSDGGRFMSHEDAVRHALKMIADGADIIDVGGESSRPGARPVTADEEIRRVVPVIEALKAKSRVLISVDTCKAQVADEALAAGAGMLNDITALGDPAMGEVAARHGCDVVLMHMLGTPGVMQDKPRYGDVIADIRRYLRERSAAAEKAGIAPERLILDPGIGFGKTPEHNLEIIARIGEFREPGRRLMAGPSRKSFIGTLLGLPVEQRLEGTAAAVAACVLGGAEIVRVHDVLEMKRVASVCDAIRNAGNR
jgi:dihydropteroate synthase